MPCECGCCEPRPDDSDVKSRAELEAEKEQADRRIEELERQLEAALAGARE